MEGIRVSQTSEVSKDAVSSSSWGDVGLVLFSTVWRKTSEVYRCGASGDFVTWAR